MKHTTRSGKRIKLRKMTDSHLEHTIRYIERKAKEGYEVISGYMGPDGSCDVDYYYVVGDDVKIMMNYKKYIKERNRRIKKNAYDPYPT